jgi:exodeoxyribonuclease V beta subunit
MVWREGVTVEPFSILSRELDVGRSYFLEASAGTGKTFAIEHLVVRQLLELTPPTTIDRILVVTFTRAATRELRQRIRRNIERALEALEGRGELPDYLQTVEEECARHRLGHALAAFDDAPIFTIHAFCYEMLRDYAVDAQMGVEMGGLESGPSYADRLQVINDFFRTGLDPDHFSSAQIAQALTLTRGSASALARLALREASRGQAVLTGRTYKESLAALNSLLAKIDVRADLVVADFDRLKDLYSGLCDRNRQLKPGIEENVYFFATLLEEGRCGPADFERLIGEPIVLLDLIVNGRLLKGREQPTDLYVGWLYGWLHEELGPVLDEARQPRHILARMVASSKVMLRQAMEGQESLTFDGLLQTMAEALQLESFCENVRHRFDAAVVDEFQDTDPVQWSIFRKLFVEGSLPLVVVGDPKQSIYAFRSADIYSYLAAREALGEGSCRSLSVNYRSRPGLIAVLNRLFERAEGLIPLPRRGGSLPYQPVSAGVEEDNVLSSEEAVQFFAGESKGGRKFPSLASEETELFPFIVEEIRRIRAMVDVSYSHFAVLISDRYQAHRFRQFASRHGVPVGSGRGRQPADSSALEQLYQIYRAALDPSDWSRVRLALSGQLIGWGELRIRSLMEGEGVAAVATEMAGLREALIDGGFLSFFEYLMRRRWGGEESVGERLVRNDLELYQDLHQLAEIIADHQNAEQVTPDGLVAYFWDLRTAEEGDDQAARLFPQNDDDAVHLMTTFASKGLEFGVVFALGLATRRGEARTGLVVRRQNGDEALAADYGSEEEGELAIAEQNAEKGRLLYVALTRAKDRVYVPLVTEGGRKPVKPENKSPVELLLDLLGEGGPEDVPGVRCRQAPAEVAEQPLPALPQLIAPPTIHVRRDPRVMQSFTGLARSTGERSAPAPRDYRNPVKSAHTLPAGAATGLLVHELLEEVPLDLGAVKPFVLERLKGHPLEEWSEVLRTIVESALQTPIDGFTLLDVAPTRMRREMEFLYGVGSEVVGGRELDRGAVVGVMDLFFEHGGKYYMLDWKSNWLGPDEASYGQEELAHEMQRHDYGLQADLYTEALRRYLARVDGRPLESCFGGAYYVFVRCQGVVKWRVG